MSLEISITGKLEETLFKTFPAIFNIEDSYLTLTSTKDVDSIFYCLVMKINIKEKDIFIARYFEYGGFQGFYKNVAQQHIKRDLAIDEICSSLVYTKADIDMEVQRNTELYKDRKSKGTLILLFRQNFPQNQKILRIINYLV